MVKVFCFFETLSLGGEVLIRVHSWIKKERKKMPGFHYTGIAADGKSIDGTINAEGLQAAIGMLKGRGYFLSEITELRGGSSKPKISETKAAKPAGFSLNLSFGGLKLKPKQRTTFTRQLAVLIVSGLPLLRALRVLRDQEKGSAAQLFNNLAEDVESGSLFSQALAKYPKTFPTVYIAMVRAGEAGGALDACLRRLAEFGESEAKLKGKIKSAMMYPIIVVFVASAMITFIMLKIIPIFVKIFEDMEAGALPPPTRMLIFLSKIITQKIYLVVIAIVILAILYKLLSKCKKSKYLIDQAKLKIIIFGPVILKTIMARFSRTLATLISSGVPILQSLLIVRDTIGNEVISRGITMVHNQVREGEGISAPMNRAKVFPPIVTNMVAVGEETGSVDQMLDKVADAYEDEVDNAIAGLSSMLEPILIVFMGVIVGFIVVSLFMPLISLAMGISGAGG